MSLLTTSRRLDRRTEETMRSLRLTVVIALALFIVLPAWGQGLPRAERPEAVRLSSDRLTRLTDAIKAGVDKEEIPGAVLLIARNGTVAYFESFGFRDREAKAPMRTDAIFRIASMTTPFLSLAIMMLAEEGKFSIAHPVSRYLPEFKELKAGVPRQKDHGTVEILLEAPRREMTVQDLLRHTSGLTYGAAGKNPLTQAYVDAKVADPEQTNAQMVTKLSNWPS